MQLALTSPTLIASATFPAAPAAGPAVPLCSDDCTALPCAHVCLCDGCRDAYAPADLTDGRYYSSGRGPLRIEQLCEACLELQQEAA